MLIRQISIVICFASLALGGIVKPDLPTRSANELENNGPETCTFDNSKIPYYIPHWKDCTKFFICDNGILHLRSCQPGLHFSSTLKACDYPEVAGCDKSPTNKLKEKMIGDNACPSTNPKYPVLLPDPEDCGRFYVCNGGLRHPRKCQSGLHFNPKINACDYPKRAGCEKGNEEKPKGKIGDDSDVCPDENPKHPVLLPHPEDCGKFYICDSGTAHLKICQSGLHFNPKIKACDFPRNAGCDAVTEEDPTTDEITGDDTDLCPADNPKHPVFLPHPEDCSKFYICNSGTANLKECQTGLHFNPKIKACDFPRNAGCETGSFEKPKERITGDGLHLCPAENSKYPVLLPHPEDCGKFYICNSGKAHLKLCQSGLHFNPKVKACDYPKNARCDKDNQDRPIGKNIGDDSAPCPAGDPARPVLLPDPEDCNRFYTCNNGLPHQQRCQSGLHFNPKINACDYPERAGCEKGMTEMMAGVPSPYCPARNGKTPIFFRHSANCSVYYMCGNGLAYEFACPSRLHFNLRKKVCDYEDNSGCENSVI